MFGNDNDDDDDDDDDDNNNRSTTDQHFMHEILKADKIFEIRAAIQSGIFSSCLLSKIVRIEMHKYL